MRHSGRLVTQRQLLKEVWGPAYETETNYLRVYLAQLRRKLEPDPAQPRHCSPSRAGLPLRTLSAPAPTWAARPGGGSRCQTRSLTAVSRRSTSSALL